MSLPLLLGTVLAVGSLAVVLYPLFFPAADDTLVSNRPAPSAAPAPAAASPAAAGDDPVEAALRAFRSAHRECPVCGPRPEADARFCSECGRPLADPASERA